MSNIEPPQSDSDEVDSVNFDPESTKPSSLEHAVRCLVEDLQDGFGKPTDSTDTYRTLGSQAVNKVQVKKPKQEVENPPPTASEDIKNKLPGIMLIFNNKKYDRGDRMGSTSDTVNAEKAWTQLGFEVQSFHDFRDEQINQKVYKYITKPETKRRTVFGITLMGHGEEDKLKTYKGSTLTISGLITNVQKEPTLKNIPKLFFIQACRGKGRMKQVAIKAENITPLHADTLVHYATYEDYVSFRSDTKMDGKKIGSWFIYALAKVINELHINEEIEIHRLLTRINREVSQLVADKDHASQMPEFRSTLREDVMLNKINNDQEGKYLKKMRSFAKEKMSEFYSQFKF